MFAGSCDGNGTRSSPYEFGPESMDVSASGGRNWSGGAGFLLGRFPLVFDAPRGYHRPIVRARHPLTALVLTLVFLTGCSKDVDRVVANERLRRGQEIIGETNRPHTRQTETRTRG